MADATRRTIGDPAQPVTAGNIDPFSDGGDVAPFVPRSADQRAIVENAPSPDDPPDERPKGDRRSVDERREQLVDATIEVLAEEGLARATTRRITDQAGLALGAFHYAFRSKEELLEAVIERVSAGVEDVLHDAAAEPLVDTRDVVSRLVTGFWEFIERSPAIQLAQYELTLHALREPGLRELAVKQYERYTEAVGAAMDRVDDAPTGQTRDDLARLVVATIDGLVLHSFVDGGDAEDAKRRLDLYLSTLDNVTPEAERADPLAS